VCGGGPATLGALAARCREPESWLRWARGGRGRIRNGTRLDSSRFTAADGCAGSAGTHSCTAVERGCGGSAETVQLAGVCVVSECGGYSSTPVVGASRLADAGGTPRLAIIANQRASEPSAWLGVRRRGETASSIACWNGLHAGMDCMLEWIACWNGLNGILPRCRCARQKSGPCCWVHHACM